MIDKNNLEFKQKELEYLKQVEQNGYLQLGINDNRNVMVMDNLTEAVIKHCHESEFIVTVIAQETVSKDTDINTAVKLSNIGKSRIKELTGELYTD
ncbi:hypothetical protein FM764_12430 [Listeria monocytogenes]|nr:hypothetical protein [Listeria monocytogenes]ECK6821650.1 hypothetical protein [Listeria monocytogenes]